MLSFELSEEQAMVKETIAGFATDQIEPVMREMDESGDMAPDLVKTGWELEIIASCVPESSQAIPRPRTRTFSLPASR